MILATEKVTEMELVINELVGNDMKMTSREIAELAGKQHGHVVRDIELLNETLMQESLSIIGESFYTADNGQTYREFLLTKEQTIDLMTGYSRNLRVRINRRWAELEAQVSEQSPVMALPDFTNPAAAARAWADEVEAKLVTQEQLAIAQPKADALDYISTAVNSLNARDTAKTLGVQPKKFNDWCIAHQWMYRDSKTKLQMCSNRLQQGFMEQRNVTYHNSNGDLCATTQPMFTAKGLTHLAGIFSIVHEMA